MTNLPTNLSRRQQILAELSRPALSPQPASASVEPVVAACPAPRDIENLVAGRLRGKQLAAVADHVAECSRCADYAEEIHRMVVRPALAQASQRRMAFGPAHIAGLTICGVLAIMANTSMLDAVTVSTASGPALRTSAQSAPAGQAVAAPATVVVPAESLAAPMRPQEAPVASAPSSPSAPTTATAPTPAANPAVPAVTEPAPAANGAPRKETVSATAKTAGQAAAGPAKSAETGKPEAAKIAPKAADQPAAKASVPTEPQGTQPAARKIESKGTTPARWLPARI